MTVTTILVIPVFVCVIILCKDMGNTETTQHCDFCRAHQLRGNARECATALRRYDDHVAFYKGLHDRLEFVATVDESSPHHLQIDDPFTYWNVTTNRGRVTEIKRVEPVITGEVTVVDEHQDNHANTIRVTSSDGKDTYMLVPVSVEIPTTGYHSFRFHYSPTSHNKKIVNSVIRK